MKRYPYLHRAQQVMRGYSQPSSESAQMDQPKGNPLQVYVQERKTSELGIWKWEHYFEIYQRHLEKFVGREVNILEVGVYGGGSLEMWAEYFGEHSHIYGVDIQPECQAYENKQTTICIGDQADRDFWKMFRGKEALLHVLIDDGGHTPEQQCVTLEEMLPHLQPGGVYICEDIHGRFNQFATFAAGLVDELNHQDPAVGSELYSRTTPFQSVVHSIHFYPYAMVIEKHEVLPDQLVCPRHGAMWPEFD